MPSDNDGEVLYSDPTREVPARTEIMAPRTGPTRPALALEFGSHGVRAAVALPGGEPLAIGLCAAGLSPASLLTVQDLGEPAGVPRFPGLLERLGERAPLLLGERRPEPPHVLVRGLIEGLSNPLRHWWGPLDTLGVVVSAGATDLQRRQLLDAGAAAGWTRMRLVNRATALGWHGLKRRPSGAYLVLVLGHDAAEASILRWEGGSTRSLCHELEPRVSGEQLDRLSLRHALLSVARAGGMPLPSELYEPQDWLWLRRRIELVRQRLNFDGQVSLEIPGALTHGGPTEVVFERERWLAEMFPALEPLAELVARCCDKAGARLTDLQACLASGGLLLQSCVAARLRAVCGSLPLAFLPRDAQLSGMCQLTALDDGGEARASAARASPGTAAPGRHRIAVDDEPPSARRERAATPDSADGIIERVRALTASGQPAVARAELQRLQDYVRALELSLVSPSDALRALGPAPVAGRDTSHSMVPPRAEDAAPAEALPTTAPVDTATAAARAKRRALAVARDDLRQAEAALNDGRLEAAVALSHRAYQTCDDGKVFRAMVEVHLRAARRRPAAPKTFADDRRWLLCALADDETNEKVQAAVAQRFLLHAQQLTSEGSAETHSEAISTLHELVQLLPMVEQAQGWLQQLKEAAPGSVQLAPVPGADQ
jgi:hypothetical protein